MLKEFTVRFYDDRNRPKGIIEHISALNYVQASSFAAQITDQLMREKNDWSETSVLYEFIW